MSTESNRALLPWLVAVAFFMESLDTTILNTAVPTIAAALDVAPLSMKAVLASYTQSLAVFIPISGWMADRFGTRRVFASAIGLFTLGSILCALSTNIHGTHRAFLVLGIFTVVSTIVFRTLKSNDGANISQHKEIHAA